MPIYEFDCNKCGTGFEEIVFSVNEEEVTCPECGSRSVQKKMSTFAFKSTLDPSSGLSSSSGSSCSTCKSGNCSSCK